MSMHEASNSLLDAAPLSCNTLSCPDYLQAKEGDDTAFPRIAVECDDSRPTAQHESKLIGLREACEGRYFALN